MSNHCNCFFHALFEENRLQKGGIRRHDDNKTGRKTAGKDDKMKGLTKKVATVLLAVTMIIPAGASVPAMAAQDADAETQVQSVTIAVQNTGGTLTVTDSRKKQ